MYGSHGMAGWKKVLIILAIVVACLIATGIGYVTYLYDRDLQAVSEGSSVTITIVIEEGSSPSSIAAQLYDASLIRSTWSFELYSRLHDVAQYLQAGTYDFSPSESVPAIVAQLTHGKVATSLVTILPGQRLDQVRASLIEQGFSETEVDAALEPTQYESSTALASKPKGVSLEGYLYPNSYERTGTSTAKDIIEQALMQFEEHVTPTIQAQFEKQGLTVYQGIILASIVEKEVVTQSDREQAAQVFISRIEVGMQLGSDVTAFYGSELAGQGQSVVYDTPYNTRIYSGFPPTPISNVSESSLQAVAYPAATDWLFFVAGDDGVTHFTRTQAEHEAAAAKYCIELCR